MYYIYDYRQMSYTYEDNFLTIHPWASSYNFPPGGARSHSITGRSILFITSFFVFFVHNDTFPILKSSKRFLGNGGSVITMQFVDIINLFCWFCSQTTSVMSSTGDSKKSLRKHGGGHEITCYFETNISFWFKKCSIYSCGSWRCYYHRHWFHAVCNFSIVKLVNSVLSGFHASAMKLLLLPFIAATCVFTLHVPSS